MAKVAETGQTYATWHKTPEREARMGAGHAPYWRHFIGLVSETDLTDKDVLDFGCNQGGFLRLLHVMRPFRRGVGIDIARESIEVAKSLRGTLPIDYEVATDLSSWNNQIDVAFSYEVIYLLPNLTDHAAQLHRILRDGGVMRECCGNTYTCRSTQQRVDSRVLAVLHTGTAR